MFNPPPPTKTLDDPLLRGIDDPPPNDWFRWTHITALGRPYHQPGLSDSVRLSYAPPSTRSQQKPEISLIDKNNLVPVEWTQEATAEKTSPSIAHKNGPLSLSLYQGGRQQGSQCFNCRVIKGGQYQAKYFPCWQSAVILLWNNYCYLLMLNNVLIKNYNKPETKMLKTW